MVVRSGCPGLGQCQPCRARHPSCSRILLQLGLSCGRHRLVVPAEVGDGVGSGSSRLSSSHRSLILREHEGLAVSEQRPGPLTACSRARGGPASRAATSSSSQTSPGRAAGLGSVFLCPPQTEPRERQSRKACGWHDPSPAPSTHPKKAEVKARLRGFAGFCGAAASATALNWCQGQGWGGQGTYLLVGKAIQHSHQEALRREHGPKPHISAWDWLCLTSGCF